jgi:hypothetical protein
MDWLEQIKAALPWLPTDPKVMLDGWGIAVALPLIGWFIAHFFKKN